MTTIDATSEVFMTAFRALPKKTREAVLDKMLSDKEFREDLMDAAIIKQRPGNHHGPWRSICPDGRKADMYTVYLKRSAEKELKELPPKVHDKIIKVLLSLRENPFPRNAKKLHGREGVRIRAGNYRVLYLVDDEKKKIGVVAVGDRKL